MGFDVPRYLIIAKKIRENPFLIKALRILVEIAEENKLYYRRILERSPILLRSDLFVFEEDIPELIKPYLKELEAINIVKRNPRYPHIIEIFDIDDVIIAASIQNETSMKSVEHRISKKVGQELKMFVREQKELSLMEKLLPYVAPHVEPIAGLDLAKKAILLQLFSAKDLPTLRNRIHILLVGDPGTGKTLLLKWTTDVSDGIYRSLKVTSAGLAGSLRLAALAQNEPLLKQADGKILALDEIDKISVEDLDPLLVAMEEGIVTLTGAELNVRYKARVRVIAASNRWKKFRPEFIDRFDFFRIFHKPSRKELSSILGRIVDFVTDDREGKTLLSSKILFQKLLRERRNFEPKIIDKIGVQDEIDSIVNKRIGDTVRQTQKWLRFAFAFAKLHKTNVNGEIVRKVYEELSG